MGRLDMVTSGDHAYSDPARVEWAQQHCEHRNVLCAPGDAFFMHCPQTTRGSVALTERGEAGDGDPGVTNYQPQPQRLPYSARSTVYGHTVYGQRLLVSRFSSGPAWQVSMKMHQ